MLMPRTISSVRRCLASRAWTSISRWQQLSLMTIIHSGSIAILSPTDRAPGTSAQFHNTPESVYPAPVPPSPARSVLDHLRASTRLAAFVLLVFALKLGTAAACAKHDFGQVDPGAVGHSLVAASEQAPSNPGPLPGHAGSCTHCECHHSVAIPSQPAIAFASQPPVLVNALALPVRLAERQRDLRPPIA